MDSLGQKAEVGSGGCQQTRVSGFFRSVHSTLGSLVRKDPKVEDVVITSQVVRKKPLLVIGNFTDSVAPATAECGNARDGLPEAPLPVWSSVTAVDSKQGITIIQTPHQGRVLPKPASEHTDRSNGAAAKKPDAGKKPESGKKPDAGAGTKRKAVESEDVMSKRIDARIREVPLPSIVSDAVPITKPATRREPESHGGNVKAKAAVKKVAFEQDRVRVHEPCTAPAFAVPNSLKDSSKVDVIVQQNRNRVQAPHSGSRTLPCDSSSQDGPVCPMRVDIHAAKEGLLKDHSFNLTDEIDSEKCTTSGKRQRKDVFLGESWSLPVDLKGDVFSSKLKECLCKPFETKELSEMWDLATRRTPVLKLRQTRGRTVHVPSQDEGLSYLDHHPDLAQRIKESSHPAERLGLLRSFFFWLQHSCMEGAFKPWAPETKNCTQEDDCVLTDGLDCEVLAVVLPLDERNEVKPLEPIFIDLSDDNEVSVKSPVKTVPKTNSCENSQKIPTQCMCCLKEFGKERDQQRALYRTCGHIETCMKCVDRLWMMGKQVCLRCGIIESVKPGSLFDFVNSSE